MQANNDLSTGVGEFPSFDNAALPDQKSLQFRVCSDIAKALQKLVRDGCVMLLFCLKTYNAGVFWGTRISSISLS